MLKFLLLLTAFCIGGVLSGRARAVEPEGNPKDLLVYHDGDRVQGRLLQQNGRVIVFLSDRFGELRVPADQAVVIRADQPAEPAPVATAAAAGPVTPVTTAAAAHAEANRQSLLERFSPALLTAKLREFFGPWHGKFAFSTEVVTDTRQRSNQSLEMQLKRKWQSDEVQLKGRYDFSETDKLTTTDVIKADGLWRHDFPRDRFALYRPSVEWNRASFSNAVPNDYVLLQQEIGVGLSLLAQAYRKVRVGASENLFDVWTTAPADTHAARTVESVFLETEMVLPWKMSLTQRAVYYYAFASGKDGWENRIELSKKFTETFSTSIRHEMRRYNPDGKTQDYTRLKLLFGLDF